jgi:hypothetical protein
MVKSKSASSNSAKNAAARASITKKPVNAPLTVVVALPKDKLNKKAEAAYFAWQNRINN